MADDRAGDDARRLLLAAQQWAQRTMPAPPSGHGGPECQWCPLCQVASVLRGEHPEITERIAEAGSALAAALRTILDAAIARAPGTDPDSGSDSGHPNPRPTPRVQHIRLDDPED